MVEVVVSATVVDGASVVLVVVLDGDGVVTGQRHRHRRAAAVVVEVRDGGRGEHGRQRVVAGFVVAPARREEHEREHRRTSEAPARSARQRRAPA